MAICSCSRRSNLMRCLQASCSGWGQSDISCHPTSFTTLISGSGRKPSPMRSHGLPHVYAKERALGTSMSRLRETSTSILQKNGGKTSTRRYFPVGTSKSSFFFHKKSKTLVLADTIINIELDKIPEPWRTATKLSGMYHPRGQIFFGMRLPLLLQQREAKAAFAKIHSWRPERIMLSHGRCFESHGNEVIRRIFGAPAR